LKNPGYGLTVKLGHQIKAGHMKLASDLLTNEGVSVIISYASFPSLKEAR